MSVHAWLVVMLLTHTDMVMLTGGMSFGGTPNFGQQPAPSQQVTLYRLTVTFATERTIA